jgi:exonuclease III
MINAISLSKAVHSKNSALLTQKQAAVQTLSDFFFSGGAQLAQPLWYCHRVCRQHLFRPLILGQWDQSSHKTIEIAKRVFAGFSLIPMLLITSICTPISFALQEIGIVLQQHPFHHLTTENVKPAPSSQLSFFSLNVCGLWGGHPLKNGNVLPWKDRIASLADNICRQNADLVLCQEVHDYHLARQLINRLKKNGYADFYFNIGNSSVTKANSGLFVASKYHIENPEFTAFTAQTGNARFVNKGVFSFSVGQCFILTTHLQHSKDDIFPVAEEKSVRQSQIATLLEKVRQQDSETPVMLFGDLNLCEKEFSQTLSSHFYNDYLTRHPHEETWFGYRLESLLWNTPLKKKADEEPSFVIDHACIYRNAAFRSPLDLQTKKVSSWNTIPVTDHHGLFTQWKKSTQSLNKG